MKMNGPDIRDHFLAVHAQDGTPMHLRRAFMIYACGPKGSQTHTQVAMDNGGGKAKIYKVREGIEDIKGPFAHLGRVKYNPAYILGIEKNEDEAAAQSSYQLTLRDPAPVSFVYDFDPEEALAEIQQAIENGPC